MSEDKRCCGFNGSGQGMVAILFAHSYPDAARCSYAGRYFEKNRWWCGKHAPSKVEEREQKSLDKMWEKVRKSTAAKQERLNQKKQNP